MCKYINERKGTRMNETEDSIHLTLIHEITEIKDALICIRLKNKEIIKCNQWYVENDYNPIFMDYSANGGSLTTIAGITDSYIKLEIKKIHFDFLNGNDDKKDVRENISIAVRYIFIHSIDSIEVETKIGAVIDDMDREYEAFTVIEESLMPKELYEYHMRAKSRGVM